MTNFKSFWPDSGVDWPRHAIRLESIDAQIIQQILEGKQDAKATSKMPAFKEKLTREETESLVPVVKAFRK